MAEYLVNLNNGKTDEKAAFRLVGKLLNQSGVLEATGLTVSATTPTPDMTVKVAGSVASDNVVFITATGDTYHGWNTAQYSVTILSNATGATKYDAIVAYADTAAGSTTANNPGGLKFIAVRSSGAGVASAADITASAVGTKPYLRLADVTVANGVSSINSGNIVDTRPFAGFNYTLSGAAWASYSPSWSASTAPAIGNGTLIGRYQKVGRVVHFIINLKAGSTTTFGAGNFFFGLPFTPANYGTGLPQFTLSGLATDAGNANYPGIGILDSSTVFAMASASNGLGWSATTPFTFGTGDYIVVSGTYESAA